MAGSGDEGAVQTERNYPYSGGFRPSYFTRRPWHYRTSAPNTCTEMSAKTSRASCRQHLLPDGRPRAFFCPRADHVPDQRFGIPDRKDTGFSDKSFTCGNLSPAPSAAVSVSYRLSVFVRGGAFDRRTDACAARKSRQNTGDPRPYTSGIYGQRIYFPARRCFSELSCSAFYADIDDFRRSRSCRRFSVRARRQSDLALLSCDTVFL